MAGDVQREGVCGLLEPAGWQGGVALLPGLPPRSVLQPSLPGRGPAAAQTRVQVGGPAADCTAALHYCRQETAGLTDQLRLVANVWFKLQVDTLLTTTAAVSPCAGGRGGLGGGGGRPL